MKIELLNNTSLLITILETLNCHSIKINSQRVSCALPDGDNSSSVQVVLQQELKTFVNTRSDFPDNSDIYTLIGYILNLDFVNSVKWLARYLKVPLNFQIRKKHSILSLLNDFDDDSDDEFYENAIIDRNIFHEFIQMPHSKFTNDGIYADTQNKMEIMYDIFDSRILIPIKDYDGNIVTLKGRTIFDNYKELEIPKYVSYFNYRASSLLYGYYENFFDIVSNNEVIIVEAEKGVLQAMSMGVNNVVAISRKKISDEQINKLLELQCDIVFAFDKDVEYNEVCKQAEKFMGIPNIYITQDNNNLLSSKDSPFDKGLDVWDSIYAERERI